MSPEDLRDISRRLGLGPVGLARAMGVPYHTLKDWLAGRRRITPAAARCAQLLLWIHDQGLTPPDP